MIRRMLPQDLDEVMELEQETMSHPWCEDDIKSLAFDQGKIAFVSKDGEKINGYVGASYVLDEAEIGNICVAPEARRKGVASSLLSRLSSELRDRGVTKIFLEVEDTNYGAISLYEKTGFERFSERKDYYGSGRNALLYRAKTHPQEEPKGRGKADAAQEIRRIAAEMQAHASAGLTYTKNDFDRDRFREMRDLAAELLTLEVDDLPKERAKDLFEKNDGYPTPKAETRAVIFNDNDELLMVKDYDGKWTVPGGWCERELTVKQNVVKEAMEEAGLIVEPVRLVAIHSHKMRNNPKSFFSCFKYLVLCEAKGGQFIANEETTESGWFPVDALPEDMNSHKINRDQIMLCLKARHEENWTVEYD